MLTWLCRAYAIYNHSVFKVLMQVVVITLLGLAIVEEPAVEGYHIPYWVCNMVFKPIFCFRDAIFDWDSMDWMKNSFSFLYVIGNNNKKKVKCIFSWRAQFSSLENSLTIEYTGCAVNLKKKQQTNKAELISVIHQEHFGNLPVIFLFLYNKNSTFIRPLSVYSMVDDYSDEMKLSPKRKKPWHLFLLSTPVHMHGGLICITFCLSVTGP